MLASGKAVYLNVVLQKRLILPANEIPISYISYEASGRNVRVTVSRPVQAASVVCDAHIIRALPRRPEPLA